MPRRANAWMTNGSDCPNPVKPILQLVLFAPSVLPPFRSPPVSWSVLGALSTRSRCNCTINRNRPCPRQTGTQIHTRSPLLHGCLCPETPLQQFEGTLGRLKQAFPFIEAQGEPPIGRQHQRLLSLASCAEVYTSQNSTMTAREYPH